MEIGFTSCSEGGASFSIATKISKNGKSAQENKQILTAFLTAGDVGLDDSDSPCLADRFGLCYEQIVRTEAMYNLALI